MNEPVTLNIDRLPITYEPPFDCVNDNATCPACKRGRNNHGVCGSRAIYAVRAEHEGRRYAVTLELLGDDYLPITRQWWQSKGLAVEDQGHRPTALVIHRESPHGIIAECTILGEGRHCRPDTGFLAAEALFDAHGSRDSSIDLREQPETLWTALESCLVEAIFGPTGGAS